MAQGGDTAVSLGEGGLEPATHPHASVSEMVRSERERTGSLFFLGGGVGEQPQPSLHLACRKQREWQERACALVVGVSKAPQPGAIKSRSALPFSFPFQKEPQQEWAMKYSVSHLFQELTSHKSTFLLSILKHPRAPPSPSAPT